MMILKIHNETFDMVSLSDAMQKVLEYYPNCNEKDFTIEKQLSGYTISKKVPKEIIGTIYEFKTTEETTVDRQFLQLMSVYGLSITTNKDTEYPNHRTDHITDYYISQKTLDAFMLHDMAYILVCLVHSVNSKKNKKDKECKSRTVDYHR